MKFPKHLKTVRRYVLSYLGMGLMACILAGLVLFVACARELDAASRRAEQQKLDAAAQILDNNLELMQEIAHKLQLSHFFRREYIRRGGYYPAASLDYLARFRNQVPLSEEYFLMYADQDKVYKVAATTATNDFAVFARAVLNTGGGEPLYEEVRAARSAATL